MYEIKSTIGANLLFTLDEIIFQLNSEYKFDVTGDEVLKVIQNDIEVFVLSFDEIIQKIQEKRGQSC
jgi:hypothetical protein